jgi:hypothetical protein
MPLLASTKRGTTSVTLRSNRVAGAIVVLALFGLVFSLAMISDFEGIADVLSVLEGAGGA